MPTRKFFSIIEVLIKFNCFSFEVSSSLWGEGNYFFVKDRQLKNNNYYHFVGHCGAFCGLKWRFWWAKMYFSPRDCSDCFVVIFSVFIFSIPSKTIIIVIEFMFLGINMFWALLRLILALA